MEIQGTEEPIDSVILAIEGGHYVKIENMAVRSLAPVDGKYSFKADELEHAGENKLERMQNKAYKTNIKNKHLEGGIMMSKDLCRKWVSAAARSLFIRICVREDIITSMSG